MHKFIEGPYGVILTPFIGNKVDEEAFAQQIVRINGSRISGYVVNGSTAEFIQLSLEEQKRMAEITAKTKASDKDMIVSACTGNVADTYEICKKAGELGAKAVLVCPPYYFKYTPKEREEYFKKVADLSPVPVIMYNIPFFTQELELDIIYRLFEHKNIRGIKDSSANMKRLIHMAQITENTDISIFTGTDDILVPALAGGCAGSMTALAATVPDTITKIYDEMKAGNLAEALKVQYSILPVTRKADSETFPYGYKRLLEKESGIKFGDKEAVL